MEPQYLMEPPVCDRCAEHLAEFRTEEVGLCADCLAIETRAALKPLLGDRCCEPVYQRADGMWAICIAPCGVPHVHG